MLWENLGRLFQSRKYIYLALCRVKLDCKLPNKKGSSRSIIVMWIIQIYKLYMYHTHNNSNILTNPLPLNGVICLLSPELVIL